MGHKITGVLGQKYETESRDELQHLTITTVIIIICGIYNNLIET
jgi:hypothetical protein